MCMTLYPEKLQFPIDTVSQTLRALLDCTPVQKTKVAEDVRNLRREYPWKIVFATDLTCSQFEQFFQNTEKTNCLGFPLLREALFTFGTFTEELRKSVRFVRDATHKTIIITFCRTANEVDHSALVKEGSSELPRRTKKGFFVQDGYPTFFTITCCKKIKTIGFV